MTTVTVTGASGFLGKVVVAQLIEQGFEVRALSRKKIDAFEYVSSYFDSPLSDILIHLAETPDRGYVNKQTQDYAYDAIDLVKELCSKGYKKIIYASSGSLYGYVSEVPHNVTENISVSDIYSYIKLECEKVVLSYGGLVIRFSNLYGEGMSENNVFSDILKQIPGSGCLYIRDGRTVCDFLYVNDAAVALVVVCNKYIRSKIINVASGVGVSINSLIQLIFEVSSQSGRPIKSTHPSSSPSINILNIVETTRLIGWRPTTLLKDGIKHLLYREK